MMKRDYKTREPMSDKAIRWFKESNLKDIAIVGGKNASLGEMLQNLTSLGLLIPDGFATTVTAYQAFLKQNELDKKIHSALTKLNVEDLEALSKVGQDIRQWILENPLPKNLEVAVSEAYEILEQNNGPNLAVAVRSSATLEDLPKASFAGQQETFLNVSGVANVLIAIKKGFASLYTDRAIAYRLHQGFREEAVGISMGIQQMVRSDCGVSGIMFTLDTESGFDKVVLINSSYGLGELIVQGSINPDEFYVYKSNLKTGKKSVIRKNLGSKQQKMIYSTEKNKSVQVVPVALEEQNTFSLQDKELEVLAKQAVLIEEHYGCPMDIEWAKDGLNNQLYILQARPETVNSQAAPFKQKRYELKSRGKVIVTGRSVGQRIGHGTAKIVNSIEESKQFKPGNVLVTDMTDPNWEPIMKIASAIITNRGGRTCHAAIVAREMGIPAVVGCETATTSIKEGQEVTVSSAEGDIGYVYQGLLDYKINIIDLKTLPDLPLKLMLTVGNPERAFDFQKLPNQGIGLARLEFIINQLIGVHPRACLEFKNLSVDTKAKVLKRSAGYESPEVFYSEKLSEGIATLAAAFWPKPVIVRLSDFKSNEYGNLIAGQEFEPKEENPMLGFRGASRYVSNDFKQSFALECRALRKVREEFGFSNVEIMVPFVRTPHEAKQVIDLLSEYGLKRGEKGLRLIMMCEIPSNALMADKFLEYFDGFSIGSNDLTQLTLGLDRDSGLVAEQFDERDPAVLRLILMAIASCKKLGKSIGICGQGPSDHPDFARWLMENGIDSLSLNPDSIIAAWAELSKPGSEAKTNN